MRQDSNCDVAADDDCVAAADDDIILCGWLWFCGEGFGLRSLVWGLLFQACWYEWVSIGVS